MCGRALTICQRLTLGILGLVAIAALGLFLRLSQGPIDVPGLAQMTQAAVNARMDRARIEVGGARLTLGLRGAPCAVEFVDVRVFAQDGTKLLSAPRLAANFHLADLLQGELKPTLMEISGAQARILRAADGRIRVGLGAGEGVALEQDGAAMPSRAGTDAVAQIIRGFVGDTAPVTLLERLKEVGIRDAAVAYQDEVSGRLWNTRGSDLRIFRSANGARAVMRASIAERAGGSTDIVVTARRMAGTGRTEFRIRFDDLQPAALSEQAPELAWARLVDAALTGELRFSVFPDGIIGPARGKLSASDGRLLALPEPLQAFDRLEIAFAAKTGLSAVTLEAASIEGPAITAGLSGSAASAGPDPLRPDKVSAQLYLDRLRLDLPDVFAAPLDFDGGQAIARIAFDPLAIEIGHAHVTSGPLSVQARGTAKPTAQGWSAAMRLGARGLDIPALKRLWPVPAATNARAWVVEHLVAGEIPEVVAQLRLGAGGPDLALDFRFDGVKARYLGAMPPIEGGRGTGHLSLDRFDLMLDEGLVRDGLSGAVELVDGRFTASDFDGSAPPADISLTARGDTAALLDLIDHEPLGLVGQLGVDLGQVGGTASVSAEIGFPLLAALRLEEIEVASQARLEAMAARLALDGVPPLQLEAERLALSASETALALEGPVRIDGAPFAVRWRERYGAVPGRDLQLSGPVSPELLARYGLDVPGFLDGVAAVEVMLEEAADETRITAQADLTGAALALPDLGWAKEAGAAGQAEASARVGDGLSVERVRLAAPGLDLAGRLAFDGGGALAQAVLDPVRIDDWADLAVDLTRARDGVYDATITGPLLDVSMIVDGDLAAGEDGDQGGSTTPLRAKAQIERLVLTPELAVSAARIRLEQRESGARTLELDGKAAGRVALHARYADRPGRTASVRVTSPDAGELLATVGLYAGGSGGSLMIDGTLPEAPRGGRKLQGLAEIRDMRVRRTAAFGTILDEGGAEEAARALDRGGLSFDSILIPFRYGAGRITLTDAIARSPALALKIGGEIDVPEDRLTLNGVISPGYAVTGALDEVPLLGRILTGGEGEGIFAMTFHITGGLDDPAVEVNPLSILTPGILRGVFSGKASKPRQGFLDQLGPTD